MGEVVSLDAWRTRRTTRVAAAPSLAEACLGLAAGFSQMRAASLMLAEATAELRDLVREDSAAEQG